MTPAPHRLFLGLGLCAVACATAPAAAQQATTSAIVAFEVREINEISVSGDPAPLVINNATAGDAPKPAVDDGTTWTLTTNASTKKVTAVLDADMPEGVTLAVELAAPTGATSAGPVALSTTSRTVVSSIGNVNAERLALKYILSASVTAGRLPPDTRAVTFTLVAES